MTDVAGLLRHSAFWLAVILVGCGKLPLLSENRVGFAPWDRLPGNGGIHYVARFAHDVGHDPTYLAIIKFDSEPDLQRIVSEFELEQLPVLEPELSFGNLKPAPHWFAAKHCTRLYVFPRFIQTRCVTNLWVDDAGNFAVIERSWY